MSNMVTVSSKFQIVIPKDLRKKLRLTPGQKIVIIEKDNVLHLIPQKDIKSLRGFLKGIEPVDVRDEVNRF
ncbi:AbrB/MazE/SpoVT family DNA-binding domain-containing protein [Candidatus Bathyarchaeota archaeon]|nr:AbrB/MazE/SpoVT family DNA-binding domain-containing protein [Candidatus Bathyarchaeota archaeon]